MGTTYEVDVDGGGEPFVQHARKAAEQEHVHAQNNLGLMYHQGEGVQQDSKEALKWWRKAAKQGDVYAQHQLG